MLRNTTTGCFVASLALAICLAGRLAEAQSRGGSGSSMNSGAFGNSGGNSALGTSSAFGNSSGGMGSAFGNSSGMGMGSQGAFGQSGSSSQFGTQGMSNQQQGGFIGRQNQGGFIGGNQAGMQQQGGINGFNGGNNRNQMGNRNQAGGRNNQNGRGNNQGFGLNQNQFGQGGQNGFGGGNNNNQPTVRPQQKVAFTYPQPKAEVMTTTINTRFQKLSGRTSFKELNVDVVEGKAILRGKVVNEDARRLAERLVALEPGVRSVQNDLVIGPPEAKAE